MKKFLLLISVLFASVSSFAQGEGELVSTDVKAVLGETYRMYITKYSDSAITATNEGKKLVTKYLSSDESVVVPFGDAFQTKSVGTSEMTMLVSTVWEGTQNAFDENNIVMEKKFTVTVTEEDPMILPTFELSWGLPRAEAIANQESWGHTLITDEYYSHFPNVVENNPDLVPQMEIFYNAGNFEVPITIDQFNDDQNVLIATTLLCAGVDRASSTSGYIYNFLKSKGFQFEAPEGIYWNLSLAHDGVITFASWESVIIDNAWFRAVMLHYEGNDEAGIDEITDEDVKFDIHTSGNTINVNAPEFAGKKVLVSDFNGNVYANETVLNGGNVFTVPAHGMYIVKIAGVKSVKVVL